MKSKFLLLIVLLAAIAAGWWLRGAQTPRDPSSAAHDRAGGRRIAYYQCPMHPHIRSDQPGRCTICGMTLVPAFEGSARPPGDANQLTLSETSVRVLNVKSEVVGKRPIVRTLRVAGTVEDDDRRHRILSAYIDARVEKLFVNFIGAEVTKGQPLAALYSPTLLTDRREYLSLLRRGGGTGGAPDALLLSAKRRLEQHGLTDEQIEDLPKKSENDIHTEILAPMTGTVIVRNVYEGQYVKEGERLFEIADFSTMWFVFSVYERDLSWVQLGQHVEVTTPAVPGETLHARITFIDPSLDTATRSAKVRAELPNPHVGTEGSHQLLHKLYGDALVHVEIPEVLAVPRSAVLSPGGQQPFVYVDAGHGAYEKRSIKAGRPGDVALEVLEGLREGERVVTEGNLLIDAQSQISGSPPVAEMTPDPQRRAAADFVRAVDALGNALAADQLERFNEAASAMNVVLPSLSKSFADAREWAPLLEGLNRAALRPPWPDLAAARKAFLPFSTAAVAFAKRARAEKLVTASIYECPMADETSGAGKTAVWLQSQPPLRNPYLGAKMIDCGTEVAP
jgi:Cu(I)/Ag(I) efflux system membrane fusion protein